jgi:hypothetical protein
MYLPPFQCLFNYHLRNLKITLIQAKFEDIELFCRYQYFCDKEMFLLNLQLFITALKLYLMLWQLDKNFQPCFNNCVLASTNHMTFLLLDLKLLSKIWRTTFNK